MVICVHMSGCQNTKGVETGTYMHTCIQVYEVQCIPLLWLLWGARLHWLNTDRGEGTFLGVIFRYPINLLWIHMFFCWQRSICKMSQTGVKLSRQPSLPIIRGHQARPAVLRRRLSIAGTRSSTVQTSLGNHSYMSIWCSFTTTHCKDTSALKQMFHFGTFILKRRCSKTNVPFHWGYSQKWEPKSRKFEKYILFVWDKHDCLPHFTVYTLYMYVYT